MLHYLQVLASLGVWILDTHALGRQAGNSRILDYASACTTAGVLSAIWEALFPSTSLPEVNSGSGSARATAAEELVAMSQDTNSTAEESSARRRRRVDARFDSVSPSGRDALREFLSSTRHVGKLLAEHEALLKGLPIFRVYKGQAGESGSGTSRRETPKFTSISGADRLLLAPRHCDRALLGSEFAVERTEADTDLLQTLGVERIGKAVFFREHVLPRAVTQSLPRGKTNL